MLEKVLDGEERSDDGDDARDRGEVTWDSGEVDWFWCCWCAAGGKIETGAARLDRPTAAGAFEGVGAVVAVEVEVVVNAVLRRRREGLRRGWKRDVREVRMLMVVLR